MGSSGESLKYPAIPPWIPIRTTSGKPSTCALLILLLPGSFWILTFEVCSNLAIGAPPHKQFKMAGKALLDFRNANDNSILWKLLGRVRTVRTGQNVFQKLSDLT